MSERFALCEIRDVVMRQESGELDFTWKPAPGAPSVNDVVETLRYAAKCLDLHGEREAINRIDNLIARLEDT